MNVIKLKFIALLIFALCYSSYAQIYCESFDGVTVPSANKAHAFNIYGNGNTGFLQKWFVASGTPSIQASGDLSGVNAYSGNQYALQAICGISGGWSEGLTLQFNFTQGRSYNLSFAIRNAPLASNQPTPIDVDYILLQSPVAFTYQFSTGCTPTPAIPAGSLIIHTVTNFNQNSWQVRSFTTGSLNASYSYLWIRPRFVSGAPLTTTFLLTDSFCARQLICNPLASLGNDTSICPGQSVNLNATNVNATYLWNTGVTTSSIVVNTPDTYSVTVTGECGSLDVAVDTIVVLGDVLPPTANCEDISVNLSGTSASIDEDDVDDGSSDNCGIVSRSVTPSSFDCSNLGANTVTLTVTDGSGNSSSCIATVTVSDYTPPVANCEDISINLSSTSASVYEDDVDDGSSDNCGIVSRSVTPSSFDCSNLGANTVTLTVTDGSGNSSSCTATVTVSDNTPPAANCQNFSVALNGSSVTILASDIDNGSTDNCGIASMNVSPSSFGCGSAGLNTVTLTVIDNSGNSSSCDAIVTVTGSGGSSFSCSITSIPWVSNQITGAGPNTIYIGYGPQSTVLSSVVSGNGAYFYSWAPSAGLSCNTCPSPLFTPTQEGLYTFTLTVSDQTGCSSTCSITICVLDIRVFGNCNSGNGNGGNSPGKVYVCHLPPGNPANMQTICIGVAGVPAHVPLHGGDHLGRCNQVCGFAKTGDEFVPELIAEAVDGFNILFYPNPFNSEVYLTVESVSYESLYVKIMEVTGKLISEHVTDSNGQFAIGTDLTAGIYFVEVKQGNLKEVVKIVKSE